MTNSREPSNEKYKQLLIVNKNIPQTKYTSCKMSEDDYMALSPLWGMLKDLVKSRDGYKCRICGTAMNLRVHHTRYPEVWGEENPDDLITVCDECHKKLHGIEGAKQ